MAFQHVKPHCIAFLQHVQLADARNVGVLPGLLHSLEACIEQDLDQPAIIAGGTNSSPATSVQEGEDIQTSIQRARQLANYVFFPFSQFLQLNNVKILRATTEHQAVFRDVLRVLATVIRCTSLEKAVLEQLWTFVGLTLGGPLGSKGFESAWNDDVRKRLLLLWQAILDKSQATHESLQIPNPIVAHTLNTILLLIEDKSSDRDTRYSALQFLDNLVLYYLEPVDQVPTYLPGIASTLSKTIVAPTTHSSLLVIATQAFTDVVRACLNETRCTRLDLYASASIPEQSAPTLEDLFAHHKTGNLETSGNDVVEKPTFVKRDTVEQTLSPETGRTHSWLKASASQIHRALLAFLPFLRQNQSAAVRQQLAAMASSFLSTSFESLMPQSRRLLFEELLVATKDTWAQVALESKQGLELLINVRQQWGKSTGIHKLIQEVAVDTITTIPDIVFKNGLAHVLAFQRHMNLVSAVLTYQSNVTASDLKVERWSLSLLQATRLVPIVQNPQSSRDVTAPWLRSGSGALAIEDSSIDRNIIISEQSQRQSEIQVVDFPSLSLIHVAPGDSTSAFKDALRSLPQIVGGEDVIEHFLGLARLPNDSSFSGERVSSALWVLTQLVNKLASQNDDNKERYSRLARDILEVSLVWLNIDDIDALVGADQPESSRPDDVLDASEDTTLVVTAEASDQVTVKTSRRPRHSSYGSCISCLSLQLLSVSAKIDPKGFQRRMMHTIYPILRCLSPSAGTLGSSLQSFARICIHNVAQYTGYKDPPDLLIQNVDYILNSVSAHLRGTTVLSNGALDPLAPGVLVAVVELAGPKILPYLSDAVDEIFDSLDRWHSYDLLVSELLRVLDSLVGICQKEASLEHHPEGLGRATAEVQEMLPNPTRDLDDFQIWFTSRHDDRLRYKTEVPMSELPSKNPGQPFASLSGQDDETEGLDNPAEASPEETEETPAISKSQALVLSIMRKALYFLPHPSPFLRARVLMLISSSVPILAERTSDFFPEIHRFWPYILARLEDGAEKTPVYVLLEVINLILALVKYRGDFMQKRMTQDVLPKLQSLLGGYGLLKPSKSKYSTEYRLLRATIQLVQVTLADVPGISNDDIWTVAVTFRSVLTSGVEGGLQKEAYQLFETLGHLDPDAVWLALTSGLGQVEDLQALRLASWSDEETSVTTILESLA